MLKRLNKFTLRMSELLPTCPNGLKVEAYFKVDIPKGKICGFRKFDKVRYLGKEHFVKG